MNLRRTLTIAVLTTATFTGGLVTSQALDNGTVPDEGNTSTSVHPGQIGQLIPQGWTQDNPYGGLYKPLQEDDPRWDCRTMGNRVCGVNYAGTDYVIHHDSHGLVDMVATREDGFTEELSKLSS